MPYVGFISGGIAGLAVASGAAARYQSGFRSYLIYTPTRKEG